MLLIAAFTVIIQAIFIFHVFRSGRPYWWAFIILSFPLLGSVIYYLVEVFPNSREHRDVRRVGHKLARVLQPDAEMKRRIEDMEICGSVDNKAALAEECLARGFSHDAVRLYRSCLNGVHANDPVLIHGLVRACVENGAHEEALAHVRQLAELYPLYKPGEVRLLKARALEAKGDTHDALNEYESLVPVFTGLEARARYGLLLQQAGHTRQAQDVFNDLLAHAKRFKITLEAERDWIRLARQNVSR
jgi:hypothetical protein